MKVTKLPIEGVLLIEPQIFGDARGWFFETYNEERYRAAGVCETFVQDNQPTMIKTVKSPAISSHVEEAKLPIVQKMISSKFS